MRKCFDDRYMGPELDLDALVQYPRGSLGYTYAKVLKHLGYKAHFYADRPSLDEDTDYATMRVRKTHDLFHVHDARSGRDRAQHDAGGGLGAARGGPAGSARCRAPSARRRPACR